MCIIIDSSHQLSYTGILSGSYSNLDSLYDDFEKIFHENGVAYKYHWRKLSRNKKNLIKKPLTQSLKNTPKVNLNIIQHRKPDGVSRKEWFLHYLPTRIAQRLERWLEGKGGTIELIVDDDYTVVKGGHGTKYFIESLLRQISWRLTNKQVTIRNEDKMKATIKQANGNVLTIYASIAGKNSKWIGMVDVYLGLYIFEKNLFDGLDNLYLLKVK